MQKKYTPGPWLARDYKNSAGDVWIDCDSWRNPKTASCRGGTLATAHENGAGEGDVEANARLIAASPDLLDALQMVADADDDCVKDGQPRWCTDAARKKIDRAIAKATGAAR